MVDRAAVVSCWCLLLTVAKGAIRWFGLVS